MTTTAPGTAAEFRKAIRDTVAESHPLAKVVIGTIKRCGRLPHQSPGTVSYVGEVTVDGVEYMADSIRYGHDRSGSITVDLRGSRSVG